jgi:hypothetical protein
VLALRSSQNVASAEIISDESKDRYLGIEVDDALAIAEQLMSEIPGQSAHAPPAL